jgi:hypothetical protein
MLRFAIRAALPWRRPKIKQARGEDEIIKDLRLLHALSTRHARHYSLLVKYFFLNCKLSDYCVPTHTPLPPSQAACVLSVTQHFDCHFSRMEIGSHKTFANKQAPVFRPPWAKHVLDPNGDPVGLKTV